MDTFLSNSMEKIETTTHFPIKIMAFLQYLGPRREKTCLWGLRQTKAQTSLRIHTDWSVPLLFIFWKVSYLILL